MDSLETNNNGRREQRVGRRSTGRAAYSVEHGKRLMKIVHKYKLHAFVKGNLIWGVMCRTKILKGRTEQSLRNYFLKTVLKNVTKYGGKPKDEAEFKKAAEEIRKGICHCITEEKLENLERMLERERKKREKVIAIE